MATKTVYHAFCKSDRAGRYFYGNYKGRLTFALETVTLAR
jgi:hypothetical protein